MKKFKPLSIVLGVALLLLGAGPLRRAVASDSYVTVDSTVIVISTSMVTGATRLLTQTNNPAYVQLYVPASAGITGEMVAIGTTTSISTNTTTGSFRFPVGSVYELRDFKGPLFAIAVGTTPLNVSVLRKR